MQTAESGKEAIEQMAALAPELLLLDIWMPQLDGMAVLQQVRGMGTPPTVIMMSGHGSIETAVKAIKMGAYDYIEKPLSLNKVLLMVQHAVEERRLLLENQLLKQVVRKRHEIIGKSAAILALREQIRSAAPSSGRVLISGEHGTGKELVARAIHAESQRAAGPFVAINCAAIPEHLIESELFGYEKGAFTGAQQRKKGCLELAHRGTLFLDEIADMSQTTQAKLLRVLQEQEFYRVGGRERVCIDVRVIAASNKQMTDEVKKGSFREDLFYRLSVIPLWVPPLRERIEDVPLLVDAFIKDIAQEQGLVGKRILPEAMAVLMNHPWPGNIRELRNAIEWLMIMVRPATVGLSDLPPSLRTTSDPASMTATGTLKDARHLFEKEYILAQLTKNDWNIVKTAEFLKMDRTSLYRKIKTLGVTIPEEAT